MGTRTMRKYRKIPIISPGLILAQRAFLSHFLESLYGVLGEGAYFRGGAYYRSFTVLHHLLQITMFQRVSDIANCQKSDVQ